MKVSCILFLYSINPKIYKKQCENNISLHWQMHIWQYANMLKIQNIYIICKLVEWSGGCWVGNPTPSHEPYVLGTGTTVAQDKPSGVLTRIFFFSTHCDILFIAWQFFAIYSFLWVYPFPFSLNANFLGSKNPLQIARVSKSFCPPKSLKLATSN